MRSCYYEISIGSEQPIEFIEVTDRVRELCRKSEIVNGFVIISSSHTTAAIKINERCDRLQLDMIDFLKNVVPAKEYKHDESTVDGRLNGRGHLMSLILNASEQIPISNGELMLGDWQSIFFVELDGPRSVRCVNVSIFGS